MAHYFLDVHYERPLVDEIGEELADDDAAWHEATIIAGELFREIDGRFRPELEWRAGSEEPAEGAALRHPHPRRTAAAELPARPPYCCTPYTAGTTPETQQPTSEARRQ